MKTVLFLCGGRSAEHEISLISAIGILGALDRKRYRPIVVTIDKSGIWRHQEESSFYLGEARADKIQVNPKGPEVWIAPFANASGGGSIGYSGSRLDFDVVFPILHGQFGEDGKLQGLLDFAGIPYVGSHCSGSLLSMDKVLMKSLCEANDIPVAPWVWLSSPDALSSNESRIRTLGMPIFVKPASQGSSVGVSKVSHWGELRQAVDKAFQFDEKVVIEKGIVGRELECGVLGNRPSHRTSSVGEIKPNPKIGWYSYEAKYLLEDGAETTATANLPADTARQIQDIALRVFNLLECDGLARIDFLLSAESLVLNEVNTLPGFTPISMYPKMWEASGVDYPTLVSELIELGCGRKPLLK